MSSFPGLRTVLSSLPVLGLAGCGLLGGAEPVPEGSAVVVRLHDPNQAIELALANESHPGLNDVYSHERQHANLKLAPDQLMGELLESLRGGGFERFASERAPVGGRAFLSVDRDGRELVFVQPTSVASDEERQSWAILKLIMDHYYQHIGGLQYVANPDGSFRFKEPRRL